MMQIKTIFIVPLLMALALLTRLPVTRFLPKQWQPQQQGLSTLYYPLVGFILAVLLYLFNALLPAAIDPLIAAVLIVVAWVGLTGALHLDGLADSIDAAFYSHHIEITPAKKETDNNQREQNIEKILGVFKDPRAGSMAVIALVLVLLLKVLLLAHLLEQLWLSLLITLSASRLLAALLIAFTPYVSPKGLGENLARHVHKNLVLVVAIIVVLVVLYCLPLITALLLMLVLGAFFIAWRQYWLSRIGGFVGDCAGALIELSEVLILLVLYFATLS